MIRDYIVVGICNTALSQRMQMDTKLTLESAKMQVRQSEAVQEQQLVLHSPAKQEMGVEMIRSRGRPTTSWSRGQSRSSRGRPQKERPSEGAKCSRCRRGPHPRQACPARDVVCHNCQKKGHYSAQCRTESDVKELTQADTVYDTSYLTAVTNQPNKAATAWIVAVAVNGKQLPFKLDTGAEVTVISEDSLQLLTRRELQSSLKRLRGPDNRPLEAVGELSVPCLQRSCLGADCLRCQEAPPESPWATAIQLLRILARVDSVETMTLEQSKVFEGLGTFPETFTIRLSEDVKPFALFAPRNVPIPLRKKVEKELARMESLGVISLSTKPTPWCTGMVVVPKWSGDVHICADCRRLNESVQRETHPLPKEDNTLAQLAGATTLSKLDANSVFWQIPLDASSRELTTFLTPFGRFHFNRMPFGITSAPEHFQRQMESILSGQEGVLCHMDDVLVFGKTKEEHDTRLQQVLDRIQKARITLNKEKCEFNRTTLTFLGHRIDSQGVSPDPQKTSAIREFARPTNRTELRQFLGMANQLGKFTPKIAEISSPMRELLSSKKAWVWGPSQEAAFENLKGELLQPTILMLYDPDASPKVSADASAYGLGEVLLQKTDMSENWRPVALILLLVP